MFAKLFSIFARLGWQIFITTSSSVGVLIYRISFQRNYTIFDIKTTILTLGSIGSILALATSISFAFVVFVANQINSRKHDLFYKFKSILFEFDRFLSNYPTCQDIVQDAQALSWKLKFIRSDDFPLQDWDARIAFLTPYFDKNCDYEDDPNLPNKILGYLGYLEEIVSEIGVMCIRQIIAGVFITTVIKAFILIGLLLFVLMISYLDIGVIPNLVCSIMPVFFAIFACLIFSELGWYLYRESNEMISFTRHDDDSVDFEAGETESEVIDDLAKS